MRLYSKHARLAGVCSPPLMMIFGDEVDQLPPTTEQLRVPNLYR
jgi:hypothetical protein